MTRMPSSREMMAAGTRPPRVMQTIAFHCPLAPASRQASARASRWNWSQETGKAFSGRDMFAAPLGAQRRGMHAELAGNQGDRQAPPTRAAGYPELRKLPGRLSRQESGHRHRLQHGAGDAAEQEFAQPGMAV